MITGEQVGEEFSDSFGQIINIFRNALLAFALVTLFVAGVLIGNVFTITLGQRVRELALLRAVGARWSQLMRSVIAEALLIGLLGSIVGVIAGLGVASLINALLSSSGGGGLPTGSLIVTATTWIVALVVGVGLTLLLSVVPAWRAGRVPPIAALREGYSMSQGSIRWRIVRGVVAVAIGALALASGLFGSAETAARLTLLVLGAILIFFGVSRLTPLVARPAARVLGWPFARLYGVSGEMARGNAARNPLRTASTATALMIGLALVSMASVVGASFKDSFTEQIDRGITADYFLSTDNNVTGFSPDVTAAIAAEPVVDTVGTFRFGQAQVDGKTKSLTATQPDALERVVNLGITSGGPEGLEDNGVMVQEGPAEDLGLTVGSTVDMTFPVGGTVTMNVVGIYTEDVAGLGNWIISQSTFAEHYPPEAQLDVVGGFTIKPGSDPAEVQATVDRLSAQFPEVKIEDRATFKASQASQIDQLLVVINALLAMSLFVAVLGIAITLALSVFERTRELGLLRAIGQQRRQTRRMVRLEAVVVAVFGAMLGLLLGLIFGLAITASLPRFDHHGDDGPLRPADRGADRGGHRRRDRGVVAGVAGRTAAHPRRHRLRVTSLRTAAPGAARGHGAGPYPDPMARANAEGDAGVHMDVDVDVAIVGAGIVGLATARAIAAQRPDLHLAVLDKEPGIARHQTGHNSGVIHAGLYYRPGSLKARLTLAGRAELVQLCREAGVRHEICGKLVVATRPDELAQLDVLAERAARQRGGDRAARAKRADRPRAARRRPGRPPRAVDRHRRLPRRVRGHGRPS